MWGASLVYEVRGSDSWDLAWIRNPPGGGVVSEETLEDEYLLGWSPDGRSLAFERRAPDYGLDWGCSLLVADGRGGRVVDLPLGRTMQVGDSLPPLAGFDWSPDSCAVLVHPGPRAHLGKGSGGPESQPLVVSVPDGAVYHIGELEQARGWCWLDRETLGAWSTVWNKGGHETLFFAVPLVDDVALAPSSIVATAELAPGSETLEDWAGAVRNESGEWLASAAWIGTNKGTISAYVVALRVADWEVASLPASLAARPAWVGDTQVAYWTATPQGMLAIAVMDLKDPQAGDPAVRVEMPASADASFASPLCAPRGGAWVAARTEPLGIVLAHLKSGACYLLSDIASSGDHAW
jgi:hypothetical protein